MKTREEFKRKFRFPLIGMSAWGAWIEARGTPTQMAEARVEMPANVELLMDLMYDYLIETPPKGMK